MGIRSVLLIIVVVYCSNNRVDGLLNVTNEAILIGRKLIEEVNRDVEFSSVEMVQEWLKRLLENLIHPFESLLEAHESNASKLYLDYVESDECLKNALGSDLSDLQRHYPGLQYLDVFRKRRHHGLFDREHLDTLKVLADDREKFRGKGIQERLDNVHDVITTSCQPNLVDVLKFYEQLHWVCKDLSAQQLLYSAIKHVALLDARLYVASQLARACLKIALESRGSFAGSSRATLLDELGGSPNETALVERMRDAEQLFFERNVKSLLIYKSAMHNEALDIPTCELFEAEQPSAELENLFKRHVVNEVDLNAQRSCYHSCPYYQNTRVYGCYEPQLCPMLPACPGKIVGCGLDLASVEVCAPESRYEHRVAMQDASRDCRNRTRAHSWQRWLYACSYCLCVCEIGDERSDRYFNLRPVLADVRANRVVTDVRLRKANHVVHVQIEEAELLAGGVTAASTRRWRPVDNYTVSDASVKEGIDYHVVSWDGGRSVALDTLRASDDKALTGLRLASAAGGLLKLEVRVTRFNFTTGSLLAESSYWCSNDADLDKRTQLNIEGLRKSDETIYSAGQYVKFTASMRFGAGQRTIPLISTLPAASGYSGPMCGAALGLKNVYNSDPTLTLQLLSFDVEPYVQV